MLASCMHRPRYKLLNFLKESLKNRILSKSSDMSKSGISLRRGKATALNTEQRESEHDARFPRHPKCHLSTVPAQPHHAMALLQHRALLQPKHSHRTIALTQNMQGPCTTGHRDTIARKDRLLATGPTATNPPTILILCGVTNRRSKTQQPVLLPGR